MRARSLALALTLASLAASLPAAAPAGAAVGDLTYRGCLADDDGASCVALPGAPLNRPFSVALSPAGDSVYVASAGAGVVATFSRNGEGTLSYGGCMAAGAFPLGCLDLPGGSLDGAIGVVVSPDGASVYVTASQASAVSHFFRGAGGGLAFGGCFANSNNRPPCGDLPGSPIQGAAGVATSPDGKSLYVASAFSESLSQFSRTETGQLTFGGCYAETVVNGCSAMGGPMEGAREVVVTPDGRFVYATPRLRDAVVGFTRLPSGQLAFAGCNTSDDFPACGQVPGELLRNVEHLAISPDGRFLYVAGESALLAFAIQAAGKLLLTSCLVAGDPEHGCAGASSAALFDLDSLAISPDGHSLYAASRLGGTLATFRRDPADGRLVFATCVAGEPKPGSPCTALPGAPLLFPQDVAISPDGASVYVVDVLGNSISTFSRDTGAVLPPPAPPVVPARPSARCAGKPATIVGTPRKDTLRGTPRRDVIAGLGGADTIRGRGGVDLICGGKGKDTIFGGVGIDRCLGGSGDDEVTCERGRKG